MGNFTNIPFGHYIEFLLEIIIAIIYIAGIVILILGFIKSLFKFIKTIFKKNTDSYGHENEIRMFLGTYTLLGLDFIIIADIIHSVINTEIQQLYSLGIIVIIRIAIAYFLGKELKEIKEKK
ncbi:MAG TPA: DUF1622 domain-containing protein [Candidatus Absconditabacterales bacterium]|nr:DUF1622 domain-containing protein [Candidatus Absconditabacterales bacterium]